MPSVRFYDDAAAFLADAAEHLAADPVLANVLAGYADRDATEGVPEAPFHWYATLVEGGRVVGAAMRTAPFAPYPPYLVAMPDDAAVLLARTLHERGEHPGGANGVLPATDVFARESARLWGGEVTVSMQIRAWELGTLRAPVGVPGAARLATRADLARCIAWYDAFPAAAREQAGNAALALAHHTPTEEEMLLKIDGGRVLLWEVAGEPVSLAGIAPPVLGVGRVAPVYTPPEHRGHGYASACAAEGSRRLRELGRVCLTTDVANPVSNRIYAAIGYQPLADLGQLTLDGAP
jgi:GNAT superfamily N-acetyltransferase